MKLQLSDLANLQPIKRVVIHSIDWMIYQVTVEIEGKERLLYEDEKPLRFHNMIQIKELMETLKVESYVLRRDNSTYDEMVGQQSTDFKDTFETALPWKQVVPEVH
ncbi:DUF6482 family protein [Neptunomonas sp. XY-337]|uniref:DUF6482 family protein n=1 Tax=Neptunomonas sp. XY-337 TaxID=2561897 RepID=UPI0010AA9680|nr:DUF6482 family protein [Neptunomonas sp. XY-337]